MAHLVAINTPRSDSERDAQILLTRLLPSSWIVTTNIYEYNFPGKRKPEIDSIVICPLGLFVLDFKNYRGAITPMVTRAWLPADVSNALEQCQNNIFSVKDLLRSYEEKLGEVWVEWLVVLSH